MHQVSIMWFRRDLRLEDNAALYHALKSGTPVIPIFIFDKIILDQLEDRSDRRVEFIYSALEEMQQQLLSFGSTLQVYYGTPLEIFSVLVGQYAISGVFTNHDYEPYALERDQMVKNFLGKHSIPLLTYKDQVIFEKSEVVKDDKTPYTVFTPYSRRWKAKLSDADLQRFSTKNYYGNFYLQNAKEMPSLAAMGFTGSYQPFPSKSLNEELVKKYADQRNFPALNGTSRLGVHLRFGTISIRKLVAKSMSVSATYLNELIWREFYQMILWQFPHVGKYQAFKPAYDAIKWRKDEKGFERWCYGQTGYPIVDAGMRELNATGFMHNRVRMIVASFLSKHLLIDWRWGEAYFAQKLLDYELASNNGGWQWAAGTGCDAAPYFRIFNPALQTKKFDANLDYVKRWVPEFQEFTYPAPIVDHELARKRCLEVYGAALKNNASISSLTNE